MLKNPPTNAGDTRDMGSIPETGRSPRGGNGNPLQYSCLKNSTDRGAWQASIHGVTKSQTNLRCAASKHKPLNWITSPYSLHLAPPAPPTLASFDSEHTQLLAALPHAWYFLLTSPMSCCSIIWNAFPIHHLPMKSNPSFKTWL